MEEIADYLYQQKLSNEFVLNYLSRFEIWLDTLLGQFPESGSQCLNMEKAYVVWSITNTVSSIVSGMMWSKY